MEFKVPAEQDGDHREVLKDLCSILGVAVIE